MRALWTTLASALTLTAGAHRAFVGAALAIDIASLVVMAARWRIFLSALKCRPTFWDALLSYSGGVCVCNLTPARTVGGDACRVALIRSRTGASARVLAVSVLYDRASELPGLAVLALLAAPVWFSSRTAVAAAAATGCAFLVACAVRPLREAVGLRVRRLHDAVVGVKMSGSSVARAVGCSMIVWAEDVVRIMLIAAAFRVFLSPSQAAMLSVLRLLGGLVPIPAGLGVVDGAIVGGLVWMGVPAATAAAIAIVERAIVFGFGTVLGALSLSLLSGWKALAWQTATRCRALRENPRPS